LSGSRSGYAHPRCAGACKREEERAMSEWIFSCSAMRHRLTTTQTYAHTQPHRHTLTYNQTHPHTHNHTHHTHTHTHTTTQTHSHTTKHTTHTQTYTYTHKTTQALTTKHMHARTKHTHLERKQVCVGCVWIQPSGYSSLENCASNTSSSLRACKQGSTGVVKLKK